MHFDRTYFSGTDPGLVVLDTPPPDLVGNLIYTAVPARCCKDPAGSASSVECGDVGYHRKLYGLGNPYFPVLPTFSEECFHAQADMMITAKAGGCWPAEAEAATLHKR